MLTGAQLDAARAVLDQSVIEQSVPRPRLGDWWQEALARFFAFVASFLSLDSATVRTLVFGIAWTVIAIAGLALLWLVWNRLRRRPESVEDELVVHARQSAATELDERDLSRELAEALASGNVAVALEAMWLLLAGRLGADGLIARKEWTPRVLLAEAGTAKAALSPPLRELERHTYGDQRTSVEQLKQLWQRLERVVPARSSVQGSVGT